VFAVALMLDAIQVGELDRIGLVKLVSCAVVAGLACAATLRWARDATDSGRASAPTIAGAIVVAAAGRTAADVQRIEGRFGSDRPEVPQEIRILVDRPAEGRTRRLRDPVHRLPPTRVNRRWWRERRVKRG